MLFRGISKTLLQSTRVNLSIYEKNVYNFGKIKKFVLPDLGEKIKEATIKKWHVKEGDMVEEYQTLVDVSTDKLFTQIPSSEKGKIHKRCFGEEEACEVGQVLLEIEVDEGVETTTTTTTTSTSTSAQPETKKTVEPTKPTQTIESVSSTSRSSETLATPAVRALAREHKIDIKQISGTGKDGRVMKGDILNFIDQSKGTRTAEKAQTATQARTVLQGLSKKVVTMTNFQRGMQKSMTEAASIPHFNFKDEFDVTRLVQFRENLKKNKKIKITFMPFIMKAISLALNDYPIINSWYDKAKPFEYNIVENHNISFAIDSPQGLVVPNVKNVQNLSVLEIHEEFNRIISAAQAGTLGINDLSEGTFSISNIGNIGGTYLGPVVLIPQVCIVAIGKTQLLPKYIQDSKGTLNLEPRNIMNVSFGCDHRVLDGATVARFSTKWKGYLEDPESMILSMK